MHRLIPVALLFRRPIWTCGGRYILHGYEVADEFRQIDDDGGLLFTDISHEHFRWRAEVSTDGEASWEEVQVIEAFRVDG